MGRLDDSVDIANSIDTRWKSIFNRLIDENGRPRKKITAMRRARVNKDLRTMTHELLELTDKNHEMHRAAADMRRFQ